MCRTLLGDKGKPLSRDKVTRMDDHGPNIQQGRISRIRTDIYAYKLDKSAYCTRSKW